MKPDLFEVIDVKHETDSSVTLEIARKDGGEFKFQAGQFNMLYVFGIGEVAISISSDPENKTRIKHTIRNVGKVTEALCRLKKGDAVGVRGSFGNSWSLQKAESKDVVIIAGGCGLAPLRSMIYQIISDRESYKKVTLLYGVNSLNDAYFLDEFEKWRKKNIDIQIISGNKNDSCNNGLVTELIAENELDVANSTAFICGPERMMMASADILIGKNLLKSDIFISMERNMKCAVGICGRCQFGGDFICRDGAIFSYDKIESRLLVEEL